MHGRNAGGRIARVEVGPGDDPAEVIIMGPPGLHPAEVIHVDAFQLPDAWLHLVRRLARQVSACKGRHPDLPWRSLPRTGRSFQWHQLDVLEPAILTM